MSKPAGRPPADEEWEALMQQLRLQPKAQPKPFFYARVRHRLAAEPVAAGFWRLGWVRRPAYALLLGALVLAVSGDGAALPPAAAHYDGYQPSPAPQVAR